MGRPIHSPGKKLTGEKTDRYTGKDIAMPIVLHGDAAYPLKTCLLKPYTNHANLQAAQMVFNYRLCRARMTIKSTFGRLKGRLRCLQKKLIVSVDFASIVITACAFIHDLCEKRHERYMDEEGEEEHEERDDRDGDKEEAQPSAIILRNDLVTYFAITE